MNNEDLTTQQEPEQYVMVSTNGMRLMAIFGKINSIVEILEDKILLDIRPKRLNHNPEVYIKDVSSVEHGMTIAISGIIFAIVGIIATILYLSCIIFIPLDLWFYSNTTVTIKLKNGESIKMYSSNKKAALECYEALQKSVSSV